MFELMYIAPHLSEAGDVDLTNALAALTSVGVLPVISVVAILTLAAFVYRRFKR